MYSLSIHFGPNALVWGFLFKDRNKAVLAYDLAARPLDGMRFIIEDEFGQKGSFFSGSVHGVLLEDLDLTDEAKIVRSLANARNEVKARQRAATDPTIRSGMQQGGNAVLTPFPRN